MKHQSNNKAQAVGDEGGDGTWGDKEGKQRECEGGMSSTNGSWGRAKEGRAVQDPRDVLDVSWVIGFLFLFAFD